MWAAGIAQLLEGINLARFPDRQRDCHSRTGTQVPHPQRLKPFSLSQRRIVVQQKTLILYFSQANISRSSGGIITARPARASCHVIYPQRRIRKALWLAKGMLSCRRSESCLTMVTGKAKCSCLGASYILFVNMFLDTESIYICLYSEIPDLSPEVCVCLYL